MTELPDIHSPQFRNPISDTNKMSRKSIEEYDLQYQPVVETRGPHNQKLDHIFHKVAPYLMEFIGTFFLVYFIGLSDPKGMPSISIGFGLMVLVFMGGHISGAHYNPAVTLGVLLTLRGKIKPLESALYVLAQLLGSITGAAIVYALAETPMTGPQIDESRKDIYAEAIGAEMSVTFLLVYVVLSVATTKQTENNSYYGLAIGATVLCGASTAGKISGGAFNPAVGTGPMLVYWMATGTFYTKFWIYWVGPLAGSILAAAFFRIANAREYFEIDNSVQ
eukprot:TRINITY_DN9960_c0_g1_i1.p1 TRINITY_DN9960_c0_g1~~TRINITY_DN9960_c0_g1_i1.p1  ORF type:complete len:278 (+),score=39.70 TRINITY_DN9960_c0_g1_i1:69-902(+)